MNYENEFILCKLMYKLKQLENIYSFEEID